MDEMICGVLNQSHPVDSDEISASVRHDAFMCVIFGLVTKLWFTYHNLKHDHRVENFAGAQNWCQTPQT